MRSHAWLRGCSFRELGCGMHGGRTYSTYTKIQQKYDLGRQKQKLNSKGIQKMPRFRTRVTSLTMSLIQLSGNIHLPHTGAGERIIKTLNTGRAGMSQSYCLSSQLRRIVCHSHKLPPAQQPSQPTQQTHYSLNRGNLLADNPKAASTRSSDVRFPCHHLLQINKAEKLRARLLNALSTGSRSKVQNTVLPLKSAPKRGGGQLGLETTRFKVREFVHTAFTTKPPPPQPQQLSHHHLPHPQPTETAPSRTNSLAL